MTGDQAVPLPPGAEAEPADVIAWLHALQAGMQAQRDFRVERLGNPEWDSDWDDEVEAILETVWPHIAAHERAQGAAAEREACAQLAEQRARYLNDENPIESLALRVIADLIRARTTP